MLILSPEEAKPGMTLAAPVYHPGQPEQELLKRGYTLEETILKRLRDLEIDALYIDYPSLDEIDRHLDAYLSPARRKIYSQIKETITAAQQRSRPAVSFTDYYASVREMVLTLVSQGQHPVYLDLMSGMGNDAVAHAASVAHLSLLIGISLERYLIAERKRLPAHHAKEVVNLGVAGMLHDMGKLKLPAALQQCDASCVPEDAAQRAEWENHARLSYEMIHDGVEPSAASAVLHHHQSFDGTGFPTLVHKDGQEAPLLGDQIHVFARIIAAADLFDRLTRVEGEGKGKSKVKRRCNAEVLHILRTRYAHRIDPVILKGLHVVAPPFSPGARVTLSDKTDAIVVRPNPQDPYRPGVRRIEAQEWKLAKEMIDLRTPGAPSIQMVGATRVTDFIPAPEPTAAVA